MDLALRYGLVHVLLSTCKIFCKPTARHANTGCLGGKGVSKLAGTVTPSPVSVKEIFKYFMVSFVFEVKKKT